MISIEVALGLSILPFRALVLALEDRTSFLRISEARLSICFS